jgi:hypothetical protein
MRSWNRWQDWTLVIIGVLLFIAPFVFGATAMTTAAWTAYIGGVLLVIFGLVSLANPMQHTSAWIEGLIGVLLFIAPWVLGFSGVTDLAWSSWIAGVLAFLLAGSVLFAREAPRPTVAHQH